MPHNVQMISWMIIVYAELNVQILYMSIYLVTVDKCDANTVNNKGICSASCNPGLFNDSGICKTSTCVASCPAPLLT